MTHIDIGTLGHALFNLVGSQAAVFVYGADPDEPEGDVPIGSNTFAVLVAEEYQRLIALNHTCPCGAPPEHFLHQPSSTCDPCRATQDHHEFGNPR